MRTVAELGHAVFRKLQDGGKPSFGFVNGLALGGGLEVALHCTYRTVMDSAPALGLPEVMLGLVPGWGGAWLVPNLVGADKAVTLIVENPLNQGRTLGGQAAYDFGLADAVFNGADFLEQSLLWAAYVLRGETVVERPRSTGARRGTRRSSAPAASSRPRPAAARPAAAKARRAHRRRRVTPTATPASPPRTTPSRRCRRPPSCSPRSTRSTWCRSGPSGRRARPTGRWPAR